MITYYHKFARDMSGVLHPLYQLVRSDTWKWGPTEEKAYNDIINVIETGVLVPYSLTKSLRLTTDASRIGAAAIISHVEGEEEFPIAFASKTFTPTEQRYPQHEREATAIMFGIKKFHKYLYGRDFEIVTDNQPIVALFCPKDHVRPLAPLWLSRWGMLSAYRYKKKVCQRNDIDTCRPSQQGSLSGSRANRPRFVLGEVRR
jgi:hypothetical protein